MFDVVRTVVSAVKVPRGAMVRAARSAKEGMDDEDVANLSGSVFSVRSPVSPNPRVDFVDGRETDGSQVVRNAGRVCGPIDDRLPAAAR